jgi:hypothetical protein
MISLARLLIAECTEMLRGNHKSLTWTRPISLLANVGKGCAPISIHNEHGAYHATQLDDKSGGDVVDFS